MIENIINRLKSPTGLIITKPLSNVLFSFLICAVFLIIVLNFFPVQFDTNDDYVMMYTYAGYFSGSPDPYIPFTSIIFGYIVCGLYTLFPAFPCYAIFLIFVMFVSSVVISCCISEAAIVYDIPFILCILFTGLFLFGFALYPFVFLQWTTAAGFPAAAAIALAITFVPQEKQKSIVRCSLMVVLCSLSFIIRRESFISAGIILGSILFYKMFKNRKNILRTAEFKLFLAISLVIVSVNIFSAYKEKTIVDDDFIEWYKYQAQIMGYADFDFLSLNHEKTGISLIELKLIGYWNFLTENNKTEDFKNIINADITLNSLSLNRIRKGINQMMAYFSLLSIKIFYIILIFLFIFAFYARLSVFKEKKSDILKHFNIPNKLYGFVLFIILCFYAYLILLGRLPPRVIVMLNLMLSPVIIIMLCALYGKPIHDVKEEIILNKTLSFGIRNLFLPGIKIKILIAILLAVCIFLGIQYPNNKNNKFFKFHTEILLEIIEKHAMNNPQYLYIKDLGLQIHIKSSPFKVFGEQKPTNLMFWGGWTYFTPMWYRQLQLNGMEYLNYESFLNDYVFLITMDSPLYTFYYFDEYMKDKYSKTDGGFVILDSLNYFNTMIYIAKFVTNSTN